MLAPTSPSGTLVVIGATDPLATRTRCHHARADQPIGERQLETTGRHRFGVSVIRMSDSVRARPGLGQCPPIKVAALGTRYAVAHHSV